MRAIDADRLKQTLTELDVESADLKWRKIMLDAIQKVFPALIDDEPTIDMEPIKRGRWMYPFYCSECGFTPYYSSDLTYNYCPNCGSKQDLGGDSE